MEKKKIFWRSSNGQWFLLITVFIIFYFLDWLNSLWGLFGAFITSFIIWRVLMIATGGDKEELKEFYENLKF